MTTIREVEEHIMLAKISGKQLIFHDVVTGRNLEYVKITATNHVLVRINRPWFTESPVAYCHKTFWQLTNFMLILK